MSSQNGAGPGSSEKRPRLRRWLPLLAVVGVCTWQRLHWLGAAAPLWHMKQVVMETDAAEPGLPCETPLWQSMHVRPRIPTCLAWFILTLPKVVPKELRLWQPLRVQAAREGVCT